ncbi:ice-binding family protein [Lacinutrix sp. Bg11-31]|uniref:ice-binding family protein n=1 Tax=Lacinutrix sp. Bg11-31 TaxID=2057808 RepID=UPI000C316D41|nr:ice-binding family protein [Lacinutrix sp. Bg11-31]AUC82182.1 hypothetical protein CW733_08590 [Lacinutrix sp. Bg11-31]
MKPTFNHFLISFVLLFSISLNAQVGIGTEVPDDSSMLDVFSVEKGFLMPRLTTTERDNMVLPANGLMIYNTSYNDGQLNTGTPLNPIWVGVKGYDEPTVGSVVFDDIISTISTSSLLVPGMTVSPQVGTFLVLFNAQQNNLEGSSSFSSSQAIIDMDQVYQDLTAMPGGVPHAAVFTGGEVLSPGVYDVAGAASIGGGVLTLDGGGDSDSVFIIRSTGAFTTAATSSVVLINGATSNNVFWMSQAAMSTASGAAMKGTLVSLAGAISLGASSSLEGRMFTKSGAVSIAASCIVTVPLGDSFIDLGVLSTLAMWSSNGAISDTATSSITGDVGTGLGAITIVGTHFGAEYSPGTMSGDATTYSIYQNGFEVVNSSRIIKLNSSVVSLQAMITTLAIGESIEVRWKVNGGESILNNRVLSLIRSVY